MRRQALLKAALLTSLLVGAFLQAARADFELTDSKGRRVLLKDNGTWSYVDAKEGEQDKAAAAPEVPEVQADLHLTQRVEAPGGCRFDFMLTNNLPYEIKSLAPEFSVERANGVVYESKIKSFGSVKPGNKQGMQLQFEGITCQAIARLQVLGGDRCEMGELNKFTDVKGRCLALLRVVPSDLMKFEK